MSSTKFAVCTIVEGNGRGLRLRLLLNTIVQAKIFVLDRGHKIVDYYLCTLPILRDHYELLLKAIYLYFCQRRIK